MVERADDIALEQIGTVFLHVDLIHRQLDRVLLETIEPRPLHGGQHLAVDAQLFVAARVRPLGELGVVALARHHQRGQQQDAAAVVLFQQAFGDGPRGLRLDRHVAGGAELRAELHESQAQEVIDLGERGHRALAAAAAGALLDGHRRRDAVDGVDVGARRGLHELARIGVQRFEIAALAFVEDDVEGERGFARARHAGDDGERLARDRDVDVAQVMFARVVDDDGVSRGVTLGALGDLASRVTGTGALANRRFVFPQRATGVRARVRFHLRGRARHHDLPTRVTALGPEIDQPVGRADHVEVVLDDQHRVADLEQLAERAQ